MRPQNSMITDSGSGSSSSDAYYGTKLINRVTDSEVVEIAYMSPRLFGSPYSFTPQVDPRIQVESGGYKATIGRTMAQTVFQNPTIVSLTPGKVKLNGITNLFGFGGDDAASVLKQLADDSTPVTASSMENFYNTFDKQKYFYNFQSAWAEYANLFNLNARVMAILCGVGDMTVADTNSKYKDYNYIKWQNIRPDQTAETKQVDSAGAVFGKLFSYANDLVSSNFAASNQYVHYYAGVNTDASDNVTTTTRQSTIQSKFESAFDDTAKDIQFLLGDALSGAKDAIKQDIAAQLGDSGDNNGWGALMNTITGYLNGSKIIFPQLVDDFSYGKNITVNCRFISPYGDPESIFIYCYLPLASVLAMALPRQESANQYKSPLLVRAYCRGYFDCELGVISSLRVERGGPDNVSWTASGLPSEIEVTFDITPLYQNLMGSSVKHPVLFMQNDGLQEYLGTICGTDMKGDAVTTKVNLFKTLVATGATDVLSGQNFWNMLRDTTAFGAIQGLINMP